MAETELNAAARNHLANAAGSAFNGGELRVYTGTRPGASETATGTLLCVIALPTPAFGAATGGVAPRTGSWSGVVLETGTPGYARFISSDETQIREVDVGDATDPGTPRHHVWPHQER